MSHSFRTWICHGFLRNHVNWDFNLGIKPTQCSYYPDLINKDAKVKCSILGPIVVHIKHF